MGTPSVGSSSSSTTISGEGERGASGTTVKVGTLRRESAGEPVRPGWANRDVGDLTPARVGHGDTHPSEDRGACGVGEETGRAPPGPPHLLVPRICPPSLILSLS